MQVKYAFLLRADTSNNVRNAARSPSIANQADAHVRATNGHADCGGDRMSNIALSLHLANAVRDYLAAKGIDGQRITALGAGPDKPVASNQSDEGQARNRGIEFRILK